nr:hypothetical protein Iba_chr01fCG0790 [Ipomoea batatas]GMD96310.1 hypothetical protein Iba_chr15bCG3550 [Ipomoea batatas]
MVVEEMLRWRRWRCGESGRRSLERRWEAVAGLCCRRWDVGERRGLGCGDAAVVAEEMLRWWLRKCGWRVKRGWSAAVA